MSRKKVKLPRSVPGVTHIAAGPGPTVTCDGKTWRFGFNNQNAKARLEELIRAHVIQESKANDAPEEYEETRDRIRGGYYKTFAKGWVSIFDSPDGNLLFILSLLGKHHPEATIDDAKHILVLERDQVAMALMEIAPDFFQALAAQWATEKGIDPKKAADAGKEMGLNIVAGIRRDFPSRTLTV